MAQTNSRFFSVMVVGDNPQELMDKYDSNKEVEPYVKYKYLDAKKYKNVAIKSIEKIVSEGDKIPLQGNIKEALKERLKSLKNMSDFDYYRQLTEGMFYDNNGNALSEENPDGKWTTCRKGGHFSIPFILYNGTESYSEYKSAINWHDMLEKNKEIYEAAWEIVVDGREPENDNEKQIYESMHDKQAYFSNFKSKEDYVIYSTSYWNYAFVDEEGWHDMDNTCNGDEKKWISEFYNRFIEPLPGETLLTILECTTNND